MAFGHLPNIGGGLRKLPLNYRNLPEAKTCAFRHDEAMLRTSAGIFFIRAGDAAASHEPC
jgi:hypothetical protein